MTSNSTHVAIMSALREIDSNNTRWPSNEAKQIEFEGRIYANNWSRREVSVAIQEFQFEQMLVSLGMDPEGHTLDA
jgi:hypothetical protein